MANDVFGTIGDDNLLGTINADNIYGYAGNDILEGGPGGDLLDGGDGVDTVIYSHAPSRVTVNLGNGTATGGDGSDTLVGIENIIGSSFNDRLFGNAFDNSIWGGNGDDSLMGGDGNDNLYGQDGDDTLRGGFGDDLLDGGGGRNIVNYSQPDPAIGGVTVDLRLQGVAQDTGSQGWDTLIGISYVFGTSFADILTGDDQNNWLAGSGAILINGSMSTTNNDVIDGQGGDDHLTVGTGNHTIMGGSGVDTLGFAENVLVDPAVAITLSLQGQAQDTGRGTWTITGVENLSGGAGNDTLTGDSGANVLAGFLGNDTLVGGAGDDQLYGDGWFGAEGQPNTGTGPIVLHPDTSNWLAFFDPANLPGINDLLEGGRGNDLLDGGGGIDTASYAHASGGVFATLFQGVAGGADGDDTLVSIENLVGSAFDDFLIGDDGDNQLYGGAGNDFIMANGGNDSLYGGDGNDQLEGGTGDDLIDGGSGYDRASFQGSVTVDLNLQGVAQDTGQGMDTLIGIEHLSGGGGSDTFIGDGADNFLTSPFGGAPDYMDGRGGNDFIAVRSGDHVLIGGDGNDTFGSVRYSDGPAITASLALQGAVQDTGAGLMTLSGFENLTGSMGDDQLTGDSQANRLSGDLGNDRLMGGGGDDQLYGDGYTDLSSGDGWQWGQIVHHVDTGSSGGNDVLEGGLGNDLLSGGAGTDTASYANAAGVVFATLNEGLAFGADGDDTLVSIENLIGSAFDDLLVGSNGDNELAGGVGNDSLVAFAGNDRLLGSVGNDQLEGDLGNDLLDGGAGNDTVAYMSASGSVTVNLTSGTASGADGNDTLVGVENILGSVYNDSLTGNAVDNVLSGFAGNDSLGGRAGNDTLRGGDGNDNLTGGDGDDLLDGGAGYDRANYNVGATGGVTVDLRLQGTAQNTGQGMDTLTNIEHVVGTIYNDTLIGDDDDNWLWGGSLGTGVTGNDNISGGAGNDLIEVGAGNHVLDGGAGSDTLTFWAGGTDITAAGVAFDLSNLAAQDTRQGMMAAAGFENLSGSRYADLLTGDVMDNILAGGGGNDVLNGGDGNDSLYGDGQYTIWSGVATGPIRLSSDAVAEFGGVPGNDTLNGGKGVDKLFGGMGDDQMTGGAGNDLFVIEARSGHDTITDFKNGDHIAFDPSSGVTSFSQLTITASGKDALISWGTGDSILVQGLKASQLGAGDFTFGPLAAANAAHNQIVGSELAAVNEALSWGAAFHLQADAGHDLAMAQLTSHGLLAG